ncbi:MAG: 2Fe-2S iron-sulfur cluster binding domain-containing protein [Alphaproteobacteria bacterium]|nr:2Fe-2S iron-sulfur cluster binding domain-containing protein [Alphaproteobacteria bacterium]
MPNITLLTRDGARLTFPCSEQDYLLDGAESAGLYLTAMCHEGVCGVCHAQVSEGHFSLGPIAPGALHDALPGEVLLCRCRPEGDLLITLPYPQANIHHQAPPTREAKITALTPAGSDALVVKLALTPDAKLGTAADFVPGQYMEVGIPGTKVQRAYSIANLPNWDGQIEFLIRLKPGGAFSSWLAKQARAGDKLELCGPFGHFVLDEGSTRPRCLIGGGCGFAPVLAMLRHLAEFQDMQPTTLIFGVNRQDELFATDEIKELQAALPMLRVTVAVWHPEGTWKGFVGTAADAFAKLLDEGGEQPDVYICGPPKMLEAVRSVAAARNLPASQIFVERLPTEA